jgi:hypothetical protein
MGPQIPRSELDRVRTTDLKPIIDLKTLGLLPPEPLILKEERLDDLAIDQPILITQDNFIIYGYCAWMLALKRERETVRVLRIQSSESDAMTHFLLVQQRQSWLNSFNRCELALSLESTLQAHAKLNQIEGGKLKGSFNLPEAERLDTRSTSSEGALMSAEEQD